CSSTRKDQCSENIEIRQKSRVCLELWSFVYRQNTKVVRFMSHTEDKQRSFTRRIRPNSTTPTFA
ncbi:hypothetical protein LTR72_012567, partial [Exophiala xenobiotica]